MLRALSLKTAYYLDMAEAKEDQDLLKIGELLLPIAKTVSSETAFDVASQGIQVLGGYGYTNDYPLERMVRDVRVCSIYEGTSGIQALDFIKRKVIADDASTLNRLVAFIEQDIENAAKENPLTLPLAESLKLFNNTVKSILGMAAADKRSIEAGAYPFLRFTGLIVCAWNGLVLYGAANDDSEYHARLKAALALFATSLEAEAQLWSKKSLQSLEPFSF